MKRNIIAFAMAIACLGCNSEKSGESADKQAQDLVAVDADSTTAAKIIKTADLRFRVKDAWKTKREISARIKQYGGTLVEATVENHIQQQDKIKFSADSLSEITLYSTEGRIVAKIPAENLDQFTDEVVIHADFVDQQSLLFDDQRIDYLVNQAKARNRSEAATGISKSEVKRKGDIEKSLALKDDLVNKQASNMLIDSKVKASTVTLSFYQGNTVKKIMIANDNLSDYRPGFFKRLSLSLTNGWYVLTELLLVIANIWTLIVLALAVYFGILYYKKTRTASR
jgi:hypothetical protein